MVVRERGSTDSSLGISRRTLLRRGAAVGGVLVWAPPVVITLASPASGAGTPIDGITFVAILVSRERQLYRMRWDVLDGALMLATGSSFDVPGSGGLQRHDRRVDPGLAPGTLAFLNASGSVTVTLGRGCVLEDFVVTRGECAAGPWVAGQPRPGQTGTVTFPVPTSKRAFCA